MQVKATQQRMTHAKMVEESNLTPLYYNEYEVAKLYGYSVSTLRKWRDKTPKRYTEETMKQMAARGECIYPPFTKNGTSKNAPVRYAARTMEKWEKLLPQWGQLPEEE
jgi:hypothetical protein